MTSQDITKQEEQHLTLSEKLKLRRSNTGTVLLLDVSSSMSEEIEPERSKYKALCEIISGLNNNPKMYYFSDTYGECTKESIPRPNGMTYLSPLLEYLKSTAITQAIVITDGDMTDKINTLNSSIGMNLKIMYVGTGLRPAFLDKLANQCGGWASTEDLKIQSQKALTEKIQLLICSGNEQIDRGGSICL